MNVNCNQCGHMFEAPDERIGGVADCPDCNNSVSVTISSRIRVDSSDIGLEEGSQRAGSDAERNEQKSQSDDSMPQSQEGDFEKGPEDSNLVKVNCPSCAVYLDVSAELMGNEIECPSCRSNFFLPDPSDTDEELIVDELPSYPQCNRHAEVPAVMECTRCGKKLCMECVVKPGKIHFCYSCKSRCVFLGDVELPSLRFHTFWPLLRVSFFPGGGGFVIIAIASLISTILGFVVISNLWEIFSQLMLVSNVAGELGFIVRPGPISKLVALIGMSPGFIIIVLFGGYCFTYAKWITLEAANGNEVLPQWPSLESIYEETLGAFFQLAPLVVLCYGLPFGLISVLPIPVSATPRLPLFVLTVGGLFMPFLILCVSLFGSMQGIKIAFVQQALGVFLGQYVFVCSVFTVLSAIMFVAFVFLVQTVDSAGNAVYFAVPFVAFVVLYSVTVTMRMLGYLYYANRAQLKWLALD